MEAKDDILSFRKDGPSTSDMQIKERPLVETVEDLDTFVDFRGTQVTKSYMDAIAFMEQPVTIVLQRSADKNAPQFQECWVNGKGAEVRDERTGKWFEMKYLPMGRPITTKRKYVEVLARSVRNIVSTEHDDSNVERPRNWIRSTPSPVAPFSVMRDDDPRGYEWLTQLMYNA